MKKLFSIALALMLALTVPAALAEAAADTVTVDFEDFTLTLPADARCEVEDRANGSVFFFVMPPENEDDSGFQPNMNGVWTEGYDDLTSWDMEELTAAMDKSLKKTMEESGLDISDLTSQPAYVESLGGKPAIIHSFAYTANYASFGLDKDISLLALQILVSESALGTYTFTITSSIDNSDPVMEMVRYLDTIAWKR